jgi:hypothetical protein
VDNLKIGRLADGRGPEGGGGRRVGAMVWKRIMDCFMFHIVHAIIHYTSCRPKYSICGEECFRENELKLIINFRIFKLIACIGSCKIPAS